jgi:hypothetical protein
MNDFRIRASAAHKILGRIGLTEVQEARMTELQTRTKALTPNMVNELADLEFKKQNPSLPQTCKTYLHEWYANDQEDIRSKYTDKGEYVESDLIDFMAEQLGFGLADKNQVRMSDEFFDGTADVVLDDCVVDVKAPWNKTTLHQRVLTGLDYEYKLQLIVYCHLYKKPKGIVFYGLMDTPPDCNYDNEIIYSDLPVNERWIAYTVEANDEIIETLRKRVVMCRAYLEQYDKDIKAKLGCVL